MAIHHLCFSCARLSNTGRNLFHFRHKQNGAVLGKTDEDPEKFPEKPENFGNFLGVGEGEEIGDNKFLAMHFIQVTALILTSGSWRVW